MEKADKPLANPYVILREEFDDWAVLFDPDTGHGFGLNPTGVQVWKLLDGEHSVDALFEKIKDNACNRPGEAREHIREFIDALVAEGLSGFSGTESGHLGGESATRNPDECSSYERPSLIDLSGRQRARGSCCGNGSSPGSGGCGNGSGGGSSDCAQGANAHECYGGSGAQCWQPCDYSFGCCSGVSTSWNCHGGTGTSNCCAQGNSTAGCNAGTTPTGSATGCCYGVWG